MCCWIDEDLTVGPHHISVSPSQAFEWEEGITLGEMLTRTQEHHIKRYGRGGPDEHAEQIGIEPFLQTTEGCARFMLAGLAWLEQKVLIEAPGPVERHRRKEYQKLTQRTEFSGVKVIQLRKADRRGPTEPTDSSRDYNCRWVVDGHWRNQAFGTKMSARRLTWIHPYIKGPEDKPLRTHQGTVYQVKR